MHLPGIARRMGRRGAYLLALGVFYVTFGSSLRGTPQAINQVLASMLPMSVWAAVWIVGGLLAIAAAVFGRANSINLRPIALGAMMAIASIWAVGLLAVHMLDDYTGRPTWPRAMLFLLLMALNAVVAGWVERRRLPRLRRG